MCPVCAVAHSMLTLLLILFSLVRTAPGHFWFPYQVRPFCAGSGWTCALRPFSRLRLQAEHLNRPIFVPTGVVHEAVDRSLFCVIGFGHMAVRSREAPRLPRDDNAALQQKIRDLEDRLIALEGQMRTLKAAGGPAVRLLAVAPAPLSAEARASCSGGEYRVGAGEPRWRGRICGESAEP